MTDFQSEQLDYDRSGNRTRDLKHRSTLTIPLRHLLITHLQVFSIVRFNKSIIYHSNFHFICRISMMNIQSTPLLSSTRCEPWVPNIRREPWVPTLQQELIAEMVSV